MSSSLARKFRFVSPGIFLREVDNSQLPRLPDAMGPTIIGRFPKGPAMRPYKVRSLADFVETFGNPVPGASSGDVWREGNKTGPTYAAYAAFAWLNSGVAPANIVRLLGTEHDQNDGSQLGQAGWTTTEPSDTTTARSPAGAGSGGTIAENGGAFGLWVIPSGSLIDAVGSTSTTLGTGSLAAVWYVRDGAIALKGKQASQEPQSALSAVTGNAMLIHSEDSSYTFQAAIFNSYGSDAGAQTPVYTTKFNFDRNSEHYIRKVFNTDPILTNTSVVDSTTVTEGKGNYWLGESFESNLFRQCGDSGDSYAMILPLSSGSYGSAGAAADHSASVAVGYEDHLEEFKNPETGWFFSQDLGTDTGAYAAERMTKLFKIHGLDQGEWLQNNIKISITDIKASTNQSNPYGTFTLQIRRASDTDSVPVVLEQFTNCNLNPASADYVAAKVGDMYMVFDYSTNRLREYGQYVNQSSYVRIEMNASVENGTAEPELLPFGVMGPPRPYSWRIRSKDGSATAGPGVASSTVPLAPTGSVDSRDPGPGRQTFVTLNKEHIAMAGTDFGTTAATATVTVANEGFIEDDDVIILLATNGSRVILALNDSDTPTAATVTAVSTAGSTDADDAVLFALHNGASTTAQATLIATAINHHELFSATSDGAVVTITQATAGEGGNTTVTCVDGGGAGPWFTKTNFSGGQTRTGRHCSGSIIFANGLTDVKTTASFEFPRTLVRVSASDGGIGDPKEAYFGLQTGKTATDPTFDPGYGDYLRRLPAGYAQTDTLTGPGTDREYSWVFSLDDVKTTVDGDIARSAYWASGSRRAGSSLTALSASNGGYKTILDEGYDRFTSPLYAGFDGFDVYEAEPFRNTAISSTDTQYTNYAYNTVKRAIDTCADPEFVETNIMTVPGLTAKNLTKHLIDTCEARADALAVIDIEDVYTPFTENTKSFQGNVGAVSTAVTSLRARDLNSSYGATYYPWVQIRDPNTSKLVWVPPSVIALGTYASSEAKSELWFAPAGFTRGGLTTGAGGLPVVNVTERVVRKDRDKLYTANINPIATFPAEGIVVFGQKTLQVTPSALDRINVRRLMIYLKKEVSRMAATILFDQNVQATWTRFINKVDPFLASVQTRLGITEYKVVLDETTTTADLIDRNILYAKIFLKPARSIEYIAIDFVISRTGASFDD